MFLGVVLVSIFRRLRSASRRLTLAFQTLKLCLLKLTLLWLWEKGGGGPLSSVGAVVICCRPFCLVCIFVGVSFLYSSRVFRAVFPTFQKKISVNNVGKFLIMDLRT